MTALGDDGVPSPLAEHSGEGSCFRQSSAPDHDGPVNFVLYDGDCPVCTAYMAVAQLKRLRPDFQILDARKEPRLVARLRREGHEVNDSMLVRLGSDIYEGAAATRLIAALGSRNPWGRRLALFLVSGGPFGATIYPLQRACRNLLLRVLGRPQIR